MCFDLFFVKKDKGMLQDNFTEETCRKLVLPTKKKNFSPEGIEVIHEDTKTVPGT